MIQKGRIIGILWWCVALLMVDRITKIWALHACVVPWHINRFFSCILTFNRGVSWSLLSFSDNTYFYLLTAMIIIMTMMIMLYAMQRYQSKQSIIGELLIVVGSVSNIIDRILYGGVIDFILLSYNSWSWPVFNVADICIVLGVFYMIVQSYRAA